MKFKIEVTWRTVNDQGKEFHDNNWKPYKSLEILFCETPMFLSEIESMIRNKYSRYVVDGIKVIDE